MCYFGLKYHSDQFFDDYERLYEVLYLLHDFEITLGT